MRLISKKTGFAIAIFFIVLTCWLQYKATTTMTEHAWTPLNEHIQIKSGAIFTKSFETDLDDLYEISVAVERKIPPEQIKCLLGIQIKNPKECSNETALISMRWIIKNETRTIATGRSEDSTGSYWGDKIGIIIGHFHPPMNGKYSIEIESGKNGAALDVVNPKIKISANPSRFKGARAMRWIYSIAALFCGAVGITLLLVIALKTKKSPRPI